MTYLLDTNVVSYFLQAGRENELAVAASRRRMALVDEVRRELEVDRNRGGKVFKRWLERSNISVLTISLGSAAHQTLTGLLPPENSKDRGERASIALAANDPALTFVTNDNKGIVLALRELWMPGERILGVGVFLRRLFDEQALEDPAVLDEVMAKADLKVLPTWWSTWRAAIQVRSASCSPSNPVPAVAIPEASA